MASCEKCMVEISDDNSYEAHGLKVCEACKMKSVVSPPESCANTKNMVK